jgi:hypothetical protein
MALMKRMPHDKTKDFDPYEFKRYKKGAISSFLQSKVLQDEK